MRRVRHRSGDFEVLPMELSDFISQATMWPLRKSGLNQSRGSITNGPLSAAASFSTEQFFLTSIVCQL